MLVAHQESFVLSRWHCVCLFVCLFMNLFTGLGPIQSHRWQYSESELTWLEKQLTRFRVWSGIASSGCELEPGTARGCETKPHSGVISNRIRTETFCHIRNSGVASSQHSVNTEDAYIGWQWRNFFISAVFRHFVGQALRNVCYSDVSRRHFLNKIAIVRTFS